MALPPRPKRRVPKPDANCRHPGLPLDSRQQGRLCPASYRGRHRTFFDGHVLGIRGGGPRLRGRRHQCGEIYDFDRISCSNWSRAPHITRCTTGKPTQISVLSGKASYQQSCAASDGWFVFWLIISAMKSSLFGIVLLCLFGPICATAKNACRLSRYHRLLPWIRYGAEGDGKDGYVVATAEASGKTLWRLKVFHTRIEFWRGEEDNQWLFISDLKLAEDSCLSEMRKIDATRFSRT